MSTLDDMATLSQVMEKLRKNGYDNELTLSDHGKMQDKVNGRVYNPEDLKIIKNFRFEGASDPSDNSVLLLLEDKEGNISYIIDAYGAYSNNDGPAFDDFVKQIPNDEREDVDKMFK